MRAPAWVLLAVVASYVVTSTAAILIRYSAPMHPVAVAAFRTLIASAVLVPLLVLLRPPLAAPWGASHRRSTLLSGFCLAAHFALWISAVGMTSVSHATALAATSPIFAALLSRKVTGVRVVPREWIGIGIACCGVAVLTGMELAVSWRAFTGDLLALAGAVAGAGYFLLGARIRRDVALLPYIASVYPLGAALLVGGAAAGGTQLLGFPTYVYLALAGLAVGPQLIGHTTLNWAVKHVPAHTVTALSLLEPILATLWALWLLGEPVPTSALLGGPLLLLGIFLVVAPHSAPRESPAA